MRRNLLHTPDGVRDIYGDECEKKHVLENKLRTVLNSYGYRDIETPTFEYFEVFGSDIGTIPSRELFKFFDREGETLVLRPDFTPSIARAASKYFLEQERPVRLCYLGNTFVNNSSLQGRLKESTQIGAELIGDGSAEADAEVIAMVIQTLLKAGLRDFQISIGQTQFFKSLVGEAGFSEDTADEVKELIRNKNSFGVARLLEGQPVSEALKSLLIRIPSMFGGLEILEEAKKETQNEGAREALERLRKVYHLLQTYELEKYVTFDLGMMSSYMYYTGIIFRGYTYGSGEAIVKGGRYDSLLSNFGRSAPAIGFVVVINQLLSAMARQKIETLPETMRYLILYDVSHAEEGIRRAQAYRQQGKAVELRREAPCDFGKSDLQLASEGGYAGVIRIS